MSREHAYAGVERRSAERPWAGREGAVGVLPRPPERRSGAVVQVHARIASVREDGGDGATPWASMLQMLKLAQYRGFVVMDYAGTEDAESAVPRAARHLRGLMHVLARQQLLTERADNWLVSPNGTERSGASENGTATSDAQPVALDVTGESSTLVEEPPVASDRPRRRSRRA
jgi:hypothetical protein